ncbi:hypothetical protein FQA39_LY13995 [Lamprigera yunnana]|nr:hypothetical protein FQA39_LY13995 [Lamprigera yunnana]
MISMVNFSLIKLFQNVVPECAEIVMTSRWFAVFKGNTNDKKSHSLELVNMKYFSLVFIGLFLIVLNVVDGEYDVMEVARKLDALKREVDEMVTNGTVKKNTIDSICRIVKYFEKGLKEEVERGETDNEALLRAKISALKDSLRAANGNI